MSGFAGATVGGGYAQESQSTLKPNTLSDRLHAAAERLETHAEHLEAIFARIAGADRPGTAAPPNGQVRPIRPLAGSVERIEELISRINDGAHQLGRLL